MRHLLLILMLNTLVNAEDKHFVAIVTSRNNEKWCIKNIASIFSQNYPHFRVIYVNDASTDNTGQLVESYIREHNLGDKCLYIKNKERKRKLYNFYHAALTCDDHEVILEIDGDDELAHNNVLSLLNSVYQNENVWLTYGQFAWGHDGTIGFCAPYKSAVITQNAFRNVTWLSSQLRTFYARLFKLIRISDLMYNNEFLPTTSDLAIFYPMLEMAQERHAFIPEVLYIYNMDNPASDFRTCPTEQRSIDRMIRKRKRYKRLKTLW